jgi:RNA recognition motif-containing protein
MNAVLPVEGTAIRKTDGIQSAESATGVMDAQTDTLIPPTTEILEQWVKIPVGNVSRSCSEEELRTQFERFGAIRELVYVKNEFGYSLRYGYVIMENAEDSRRAVRGLNGFHIYERPIRVRIEEHR